MSRVDGSPGSTLGRGGAMISEIRRREQYGCSRAGREPPPTHERLARPRHGHVLSPRACDHAAAATPASAGRPVGRLTASRPPANSLPALPCASVPIPPPCPLADDRGRPDVAPEPPRPPPRPPYSSRTTSSTCPRSAAPPVAFLPALYHGTAPPNPVRAPIRAAPPMPPTAPVACAHLVPASARTPAASPARASVASSRAALCTRQPAPPAGPRARHPPRQSRA